MKRNAKTLAITGLLVGAITIGGVGVTAFANGSAYQSYKDAAMQTLEQQNMTVNAEMTLEQDGEILVSGTMFGQMDGDDHYSLTTIQAGDEVMENESSTQDGVVIMRTGEEYTSYAFEADDSGRDFADSPSSMQLVDTVTDLLVGDVKNNFVWNGDAVEVNLDEGQIPELVNLAVSAMSERSGDRMPKDHDHPDINLAELENVTIENISMQATLEDGYLDTNTFSMTITGTDAEGEFHTLTLSGTVYISDIGATVPATIDTTGKEVQAMDVPAFGHRGDRDE